MKLSLTLSKKLGVDDIFFVLVVYRIGIEPATSKRSGEVCRELHVQPCLQKLPLKEVLSKKPQDSYCIHKHLLVPERFA